MQQSINNQENVHWEQIQGNKLNKSLHPAMLSKYGYRTTSKIRMLGDASWLKAEGEKQ
jgi:hypothetical protein